MKGVLPYQELAKLVSTGVIVERRPDLYSYRLVRHAHWR
jgi:hypothetical protein